MPTTTAGQVGKQFGKLAQRRVDHRAILAAFDGDHRHRIVGELHRIRRTRQGDAAQHHFTDLDLGRNDDVDGHVFAGKQIAVLRQQIFLRPYAGHFRGHAEQRMRHLTGHHVDLVVKRDADDHVGVFRTRRFQYVRLGTVADEAAHVELVADGLDQRGRIVDDCDVIAFLCKPLGNAVANLPCPANDDFHALPPVRRLSIDSAL